MQRVKSVGKGDGSLGATTQDSAKAERRELPVAALLAEAEAVGIRLSVEGECLRVRGPRSAETLGRLLLERKAEVLATLDSGLQTVVTASPTDRQAACGVSICAASAMLDAERASAVIAEVDARIDTALHDNTVANNAARRNVLAHERAIVRRLARDRDPVLWQWPRALEHLLQRWASWDKGHGP